MKRQVLAHPADESLSALLDGDLSRRRRQALDAHLAACPECRARYRRLAELRDELAGLGRVAAPERLWHSVRAAVPARPARRLSWWVVPASVALAAVLAWLGMSWLSGSQRPGAAGGEATPRAALLAVQQAEGEYARAIDALAAAWREQPESRDPALAREVERSLAVIDGAVERLRRRLRDRPGDIESRQQLLALYQRKVDLLSELVLADDE